MLVIRFQRIGRKNDPAFRIMVVERRSKPKSGGVETLGSYHPKTKHVVLKNERISYWLSKGARASGSVHNLLVSRGVLSAPKIYVGKRIAVSSSPAHEPGGKEEVSADGVVSPPEAAESSPNESEEESPAAST